MLFFILLSTFFSLDLYEHSATDPDLEGKPRHLNADVPAAAVLPVLTPVTPPDRETCHPAGNSVVVTNHEVDGVELTGLLTEVPGPVNGTPLRVVEPEVLLRVKGDDIVLAESHFSDFLS